MEEINKNKIEKFLCDIEYGISGIREILKTNKTEDKEINKKKLSNTEKPINSKKSGDRYVLGDHFFDKIIKKEGFVSQPYYDKVFLKGASQDKYGILVRDSDKNDLWTYSLNKKKYATNKINSTFDLSAATLTIGIGTTAPVFQSYTRKKFGVPDFLSRDTPGITQMMAEKMVEHYLSSITSRLQTVPTVVLFNELLMFFYNIGINKYDEKGEEKYMDEWAPTSSFNDGKALAFKKQTSIKSGKKMSFAELIEEKKWICLLRRMSWYRRAGGKIDEGIIKRRDKSIKKIMDGLVSINEW